jgi:hypothetical protein
MHGINGYVFGNLPGQDMTAGQRVRWYLMGMAARSTCTPPIGTATRWWWPACRPATRYRELASHPPPAQAVLHDAAMAGRERMRFT